MASDNGAEGCGCLLLIVGAAVLLGGGSVAQAIGAMLATAFAAWLGYVIFIGVTLGLVLLIIRLIAGD